MGEEKGFFAHPTAEVSDKARIGAGTKVWNQSQIRENTTIGKDCVISKNVYVDFGVTIGDRVKLQNNVNVYHGVTLEDDVFCGPQMTFTNDLFPRAALWSDDRLVETLVKRGASIGANATVVAGITIGRHALVGAGSVVTGDVPDHGLVYGNPARLHGFACACGRKLETQSIGATHAVMVCLACKKTFNVPKENYVHIEED